MHDKPAAALLIAEARNALQAGVAAGFPQKVVANALGIAQRELEQGPALAAEERSRLVTLLGPVGDLASLNERLSASIRAGQIDFDDPRLLAHLILTTVAKLAIDQPTYPAYRAWQSQRDPP